MKTGFVYDDIYLNHDYPDHPERKERLISIMNHLEKVQLLKEVIDIKPRRATVEEVALNHDPNYIQEIHDFCKSGGGFLDPDTYAIEESYDVSLTAVGGVLEGIDRILKGDVETVFCAVRPPGHHAEYAKAMGFCIFNNIAIGAHYLRKIKKVGKVFIIDFDAHHGNGTQRSFYEDDTVFYFSTHEYPFYPGTGSPKEKGAGKGEGYTLNVPMPAGAGDSDYEPVYSNLLPKVMGEFSPDFILVSAGYDLHSDDPLTYLNVSTKGIRSIVRNILKTAKELKAPTLFALEGGYNLKALGESVVATIEEMLSA
ncbi:acetoin utilization deacetylase AcuC-like enzyme [Hydrogenivirga caldilitoris]|uniref:Acetoin utilization deacetylase AcuC-like enzyme n=1 Tax=Hydrogenivirga caldilitoris TaxID=246264 RepID=A0A497XM14_9AQUI|nr:histone deacetylase [Hydrogenivirga caldilitoris]RLJ69926.1 acetoin utilization deacetylase AcuC-like enzyme [Hydrogenivirga caldilitoris]